MDQLRGTDAAGGHDPPAALLTFHFHHPLIASVVNRVLLAVERPGGFTGADAWLSVFIDVVREEALAINDHPLFLAVGQSRSVWEMGGWFCRCPG